MGIFIHAFDICKKRQFFRPHSSCDGAGRIIGIDIVCIKTVVQPNRTYDREEILLQQIVQNIRIYFFDLSHKSDIFSVSELLVYCEKTAVFTADADRTDAKAFYKLHKALIHLAEHHLGQLHRRLVRHPQAVHELRFHADLADPPADLLAPAVDNDRLEADELKQGHIFDDLFFQVLIHHGAAAVFYDDDLTVKPLDIRKCFDEDFRFIQIFLHTFVHIP